MTAPFTTASHDRVEDLAALRRIYKQPGAGAVRKVLPALDKHCVAYLSRSPFAVIATTNKDGVLDASPRGGPPGFLVVQDERTLLLPDWPGNNRLDSLENIIANPRIAVLSFVPGMNEMLRVNGRAHITTAPDLRGRLTTEAKLPLAVIVITVEEAYLHCARALQRSALWDPARHIDRATFPTMGTMLADQIAGYDGAATDRFIAANQDQLYGGG